MSVTYPDVEVQLTGVDGNVFSIIGAVSKAIRGAHGSDAATAFTTTATACQSYDEVLRLCIDTVVTS